MSSDFNPRKTTNELRKTLQYHEMKRLAASVDFALYGKQTPFKVDKRRKNRARSGPISKQVGTLCRGIKSFGIELCGGLVQIVKFHKAKGMPSTSHPSFEPQLSRSSVATLLRYLRNERDDVMEQPASANNCDNAAYVRGLQYATDAILLMWASAVIAANAHAEDYLTDLESGAKDETR